METRTAAALLATRPTRAATPHYEVRLPVFNGPLDLLLHLIERRELDITLVSLAAVADQYLTHVESLSEPDADQLADFLVIAAKLLAIKALALISRPQEAPVADEDEGEDLVRTLREYQQFKRAAQQLKTWEAAQRQVFTRCVPMPAIKVFDPDGLCLNDLVFALRRRLAEAPEPPPTPCLPERQYTIVEKIAIIEAKVAALNGTTFASLLTPASPPVEIIVTFMALLELLKSRRIVVSQAAVFGEILICGTPAATEQSLPL